MEDRNRGCRLMLRVYMRGFSIPEDQRERETAEGEAVKGISGVRDTLQYTSRGDYSNFIDWSCFYFYTSV